MINWKYIKGYNQTTNSNALYTWFTFNTHQTTISNVEEQYKLLHCNNSPHIYLCQSQNGTWNDCGYIMTSQMAGQWFNSKVGFFGGLGSDIIWDGDPNNANILFQRTYSQSEGNRLFIGRGAAEGNYPYQIFIGGANSENWLAHNWVIGTALFVGSSTSRSGRDVDGYITAQDIKSSGPIWAGGDGHFGGALDTDGNADIGGNCDVTGAITGASATVTGKCEAQYFNATSDKRAKTNLKPLSLNALDFIKSTQLYSFRYKETDTPSIGIIAQDVQDVDIDGFKIVDNENATGKDMDYMTIHESKLTYILWKAIQEQQKTIETLQKQIDELKKN